MNTLRGYFSFSRRERNGIAVLVLAIALVLLLKTWMELKPAIAAENFDGYNQLLASWKKSETQTKKNFFAADSASDRDPFPAMKDVAGQRSLFEQKEVFYFNPNGLAAEDWMRLGLSRAQAQSIKNYETKGGEFKTKEDVKKLFVVSADLYKSWESFIVIPAEPVAVVTDEKPAPKKSSVVELNAADSAMLVTLNGIGPAFAKRIISYRQRLGGFRSKEQLREVYGFDESRYEQVETSVKADSSYIRKISINSSSADELRKHPYITFNTANAIVNYRKLHGNFSSVADIRKVDLVTADLYRKLAAYLSL